MYPEMTKSSTVNALSMGRQGFLWVWPEVLDSTETIRKLRGEGKKGSSISLSCLAKK